MPQYTITVPTTETVDFTVTASSEEEALRIFHATEDKMTLYAGGDDGQWVCEKAEITAICTLGEDLATAFAAYIHAEETDHGNTI